MRGLTGYWGSHLDDDCVATRERGCNLPRPHEEGEVPRHNGANDAHGLVQGVAEVVAVQWDGLAADLVGPAGEVAEEFDDKCQVRIDGNVQRLAIVQPAGCEDGRFTGVTRLHEMDA